jgi:hypothetical protein
MRGCKTPHAPDYKVKTGRQMCRLYLSMMDKMNVRLPKFGDASKALEEV